MINKNQYNVFESTIMGENMIQEVYKLCVWQYWHICYDITSWQLNTSQKWAFNIA